MNKKLLRHSFPQLRDQFNEELNVGISFDDLFIIYDSKVFWNCPGGHIIYQKPRGRTQGKCTVCSIDKGRKYLREHHQQLIKEFDVDGNDGVNPERLYSRSTGKYFWFCNKSVIRHTYMATVGARIKGHACPYCAGTEILAGFNDWMTLEPLENLKWDTSKNVDDKGQPVDPTTIGIHNRTMFHWICVTGNHERKISVSSAVIGKRLGKECRACSGYQVIKGSTDAFSLYPELKKRLHPKLNSSFNIETLHPGNREIPLTWTCDENHIWERPFADELKSRGCGKCLGIELWEGKNDLLSQFPDVAAEIASDLNFGIQGYVQDSPDKIHRHSALESWWRCKNHGHTWRTKVEKRTREGTNCPFCSDRRVWSGFNDLWTKRPDLVNEIDFDKHLGLDPKNLLWVSHDTLNWRCSNNHRWPAQLHIRSSNSSRKPTGCPDCAVSGFKPGEPAVLYFIQNEKLGALKVGITNTGTQRINSWLSSGWSLIESFDFFVGAEAKYAEDRFHFWRRTVLQVSNFLTSKDVGRQGGWTETFSHQSVEIKVVRSKLKEIISKRKLALAQSPSNLETEE